MFKHVPMLFYIIKMHFYKYKLAVSHVKCSDQMIKIIFNICKCIFIICSEVMIYIWLLQNKYSHLVFLKLFCLCKDVHAYFFKQIKGLISLMKIRLQNEMNLTWQKIFVVQIKYFVFYSGDLILEIFQRLHPILKNIQTA